MFGFTGSFMLILSCMWTLSNFIDRTSSPCPPSHLSSLLPFLNNHKIKYKKTAGTSHKNVFWMKTSTCRDGTLKNQPNYMGMTPQHFTPSLHLVPFKLPTISTTKLYMHIAYSHTINDKVLSIAHSSLPLIYISTVFSSSKISQHDLNSNTSYRLYTIHTI